jgi:hypothetical protein
MKTLQTNIDEALFSKDGINAKELAESLRLDEIKKYAYDYLDISSQRSTPFYKEDGAKCYIDDDGCLVIDALKYHGHLSCLYLSLSNAPASLFPLNLKEVRTRGNVVLVIHLIGCGIKTCEDIFAKNFKLVGNELGIFIIQDCPFESYKGFPDVPVRGIMAFRCPKMNSFEYIPKKISRSIFFDNKNEADMHIEYTGYIARDVWNVDNLDKAKELYNKLDKHSEFAKHISIEIGSRDSSWESYK